MQCTRCQGGFVALLYDELKCLNCGHRPKPLRPHEIKERRAPETVEVFVETKTCTRCKAVPVNGHKMCERHLVFFRELMRARRHTVNTAFLTPDVSHVTQTIQGV